MPRFKSNITKQAGAASAWSSTFPDKDGSSDSESDREILSRNALIKLRRSSASTQKKLPSFLTRLPTFETDVHLASTTRNVARRGKNKRPVTTTKDDDKDHDDDDDDNDNDDDAQPAKTRLPH
ncbi:hypothetical protein CONLIGDRAFT_648149 [Coniochaeta ligniaria NRRL 30616]|uniref:Uncharacterized protein n=1 Tax=Coniochaeta ligniaria NRRL 30616 TaxID=1408157 RepID=A0A1J7IBM7_9PEZI|nr:hypothetical protein CONLIGDRAFT_648149 [Coniochaeta ligniaria NRRL 30616]